MNQPTPGDRARALGLLEAAEFMRDAHFRDGLTVQEITTALAHTVDRADAMVGSLSRDGFGAEEIAEMLSAEPAAVSAAVAPPTQAVLRDFLWRLEQSAGDAAAEKFLDDNPELRRLADETPDTQTQPRRDHQEQS
ncbi:hypothetical protein ACIQTN_25915 [Streptomyces werraensis]|uniref:hypothetical protein n=1 Tax=Streptomyces werraensis TaxID=68284 RepID=UPI0037F8AD5D